MNNKNHHIHQASILMREQHTGILSTNSLSMKGFPFGSVTPFFMTENGDIVIYASDIAQHSRNMKSDNKVSLCVHDPQKADSQASARVTILGNVQMDGVSESIQQQYMTLFPQAKKYVEAHDFRFYLIDVERIRYIGGFGKIYWFSQSEWRDNKFNLAQHAQGAIDHMHEDHSDALAEIVARAEQVNINKDDVCMLTCFQHGFHYQLSAGESTSVGFITFDTPISENHGLRQAMIVLTKQAKGGSEKSTPSLQNVS
jgi:putative heme iron utilization protein